MLLRHLCGAILTLLLACSGYAAPQAFAFATRNPARLAAMAASTEKPAQPSLPDRSPESINEMAVVSADMKDPVKYSVWVLIAMGPLMWIWLAFFPGTRRK